MEKSTTETQPMGESALEAIDTRAICFMRAALAASGLVTVGLTGLPLSEQPAAGYTVLLLYTLYSLLLFGVSMHRSPVLHSKIWHWGDLAWITGLVMLNEKVPATLSLFLLFPILVSSFRWGYKEGIRVTLAATACTFLIMLAPEASDITHGLRGLPLRAFYICCLGYLVARWARSEIILKQRLVLLRRIGALREHCDDPDSLIHRALTDLRDFYEAEYCVAVTLSQNGALHIYRVDGSTGNGGPEASHQAKALERLLALPTYLAFAYNPAARWTAGLQETWHFEAAHADRPLDPQARNQAHKLVECFGPPACVSVPIAAHTGGLGRLFISCPGARPGASDVQFLQQVADQLAWLIDNIRLTDQIASDAIREERRRVSLDLHDSTIQPYLGLKLGLEALTRKVKDDSDIARDLKELSFMTDQSITELRHYVRGLKQSKCDSRGSFLNIVRRRADGFRKLYGVNITVNAELRTELRGPTSEEVLQIVSESLSNVCRHTRSPTAKVNLTSHGDRIVVQTLNENPVGCKWKAFVPRSIQERVASLRGALRITREVDGNTAVTAEIPLTDDRGALACRQAIDVATRVRIYDEEQHQHEDEIR